MTWGATFQKAQKEDGKENIANIPRTNSMVNMIHKAYFHEEAKLHWQQKTYG
jgi:hypothetical protein